MEFQEQPAGSLRLPHMSYPRPTTGRAGKSRPKTNWKAPPYHREIQKKIGQALAADYELQQELPGSLLKLLKRINNGANENDVFPALRS